MVHTIVSPAAICTLAGPVVPLKRTVSIVMRSQQASDWKYVAVAYSGCNARMVHRSLFACLPTPSVTHVPPFDTWQCSAPATTAQK